MEYKERRFQVNRIDLSTHKSNLLLAEARIRDARRLIDKQKAEIADRRQNGGLTEQAERLLAHLESSLEFLIGHHERLARYIAEIEARVPK